MKQAGNHARALARGALLLSLGVSGAVPGAPVVMIEFYGTSEVDANEAALRSVARGWMTRV